MTLTWGPSRAKLSQLFQFCRPKRFFSWDTLPTRPSVLPRAVQTPHYLPPRCHLTPRQDLISAPFSSTLSSIRELVFSIHAHSSLSSCLSFGLHSHPFSCWKECQFKAFFAKVQTGPPFVRQGFDLDHSFAAAHSADLNLRRLPEKVELQRPVAHFTEIML